MSANFNTKDKHPLHTTLLEKVTHDNTTTKENMQSLYAYKISFQWTLKNVIKYNHFCKASNSLLKLLNY